MRLNSEQQDWLAAIATLGVIVIAALIFVFALLPLVFMTFWNAVMPYLLGSPEIGYWHSMVIIMLLSIISSFFGTKVIKND